MLLLYAGKQYTSAVTVSKLVDVVCEKCECAYRYQLVRRGTGAASAPYYIGTESAKRRAQASAQECAERKLEEGIEPVACPDCGWIQSNMVTEMRRRTGRWLRPTGTTIIVLAAAIAFLATLGATDCFQRPLSKIDGQQAIVILSILGIGCTMGGLMFGIRASWAKRINPNRSYPARGDVILGAPAAMKISTASFEPLQATERAAAADADEAELEVIEDTPALAYERRAPEVAPGGWATVQLLNMSMPRLCMCCMGPADQVVAQRYRPGSIVQVPLLVCQSCPARSLKRTALVTSIGVMAGMLAAVLIWQTAPNRTDWPVVAVLGAVFGTAGGLVGSVCASRLFRPVRYRRFSHELNTVQAKFRNPAYVDEFLAANRRAAERAVRGSMKAVAPDQPAHHMMDAA